MLWSILGSVFLLLSSTFLGLTIMKMSSGQIMALDMVWVLLMVLCFFVSFFGTVIIYYLWKIHAHCLKVFKSYNIVTGGVISTDFSVKTTKGFEGCVVEAAHEKK